MPFLGTITQLFGFYCPGGTGETFVQPVGQVVT
jgi:hypothetical protein